MNRLRFLILMIASLLAGCWSNPLVEPGAIARTPATLRFGLTSYASPDEVRSIMGNMSPEVILDDSPPTGDCPPYDQLWLAFKDQQDLGHSGELYVGFINGRLWTVTFFPDDYDSYVSALSESGTALNSQGEFSPSANVHGRTDTAFDGRWYVDWEDVRLSEEMGNWMSACSD